MDNQPPCPACGEPLANGMCTNEECPSMTDDSGGDWERTNPEDKVMKTKADWDMVFDRYNEGDFDEDPDRQYTLEDYRRRAGLLGG